MKRMLPIVLVVLLSHAAARAESYEMKSKLQKGHAWSVSTENSMQMDITMKAADGEQRMSQKMVEKSTGSVEVLEASGGVPSAIRAKFDDDSGTSMEINGQPRKQPSPLAGKTVTIRRDPSGAVTHDLANSPLNMSAMFEAMLDPVGLVQTDRPVSIGDEWSASEKAVARQFQLSGEDTGSIKYKLASVGESKGRQVATIDTTMNIRQKQMGMEVSIEAAGPIQVDLATGLIVNADLKGNTTSSGLQQQPGPNGDINVVQIESKGPIRFHQSAELTGGPMNVPADPNPEIGRPPEQRDTRGGFAGTFQGNEIKVVLNDDGGSLKGEIQKDDKAFPATGKANGNTLRGQFEVEGEKFDFTMTLSGETATLDTGGTKYELKRRVNPLAKPKKRNPLADPDARNEDPAPNRAAANAAVMKFERFSLKDDQVIPGEASSFLIPAGWKATGGIKWRAHIYYPAYIDLKIESPDGVESLCLIPTVPCCWSDQPMLGFPEGSIYSGNYVLRPKNPDEFIQQIVIPHLRKDLAGAQVVKVEPLDELAQTILATCAQEAGIQKSAKAAKIRYAYSENGIELEEDVYCVLIYTYSPQTGFSFWGPDRVVSLRTRKGQLDERSKILAVIQSSLRPNIEWFNRYSQLVQIRHNQGMQAIKDIGEWSKAYAQTSSQISDSITSSYWERQKSQDRINKQFSDTIRGVEDFKDPQGYSYQLPSGYDSAWVNNRGEVIVSNTAGYDPGVETKEQWHKLERER